MERPAALVASDQGVDPMPGHSFHGAAFHRAWCNPPRRARLGLTFHNPPYGKARHGMSKSNGDRSRFNRERRKQIVRRAKARALKASWDAKAAAPQPPARS